MSKQILVIGKTSQLGFSLNKVLNQFPPKDCVFNFVLREQLDLSSIESINDFFLNKSFDAIINFAAYTSVDDAEIKSEYADQINHLAVSELANLAKNKDIPLIHISTDYVFDGKSKRPYKENDKTNPQGVYGKTKYMGELAIKSSGCMHIIIRTSWIFSEYGNNFLKTMLSHGKKLNELRVVSDQIGCPTYAQDIAITIVKIIPKLNFKTNIGTYHYCGYKSCSWFDFANEIFLQAELKKFKIPNKIDPIKTSIYKTSAKRPTYSALNCAKICTQFNVSASNWHSGIIKVLDKLEI